MLHNGLKCKILIIKVILWRLYFVQFAKAIKIDAELAKMYNIIIKQHETRNASRMFTKCEIRHTDNPEYVIWESNLGELF
jgi:hypothetical protein